MAEVGVKAWVGDRVSVGACVAVIVSVGVGVGDSLPVMGTPTSAV